jgi:hypothetical protein
MAARPRSAGGSAYLFGSAQNPLIATARPSNTAQLRGDVVFAAAIR